MKFLNGRKKELGQSLIELLVAIGLFAILTPALFAGFAATRGGRAQQDQREQATQLMREGQEAGRVVREKDWIAFAALSQPANTQYYPLVQSGTWTLSTNVAYKTVDGFIRIVTVSDVNRDFTQTNAPIVTTGGTLDPSTKKVTTTVSWTMPVASSVTATEYLTRDADQSYTDSPNITLDKSSLLGNWCKPNATLITPFPLPGNGTVASSISEAVLYTGGKGHSYAVNGGNASAGDPMDSADVTDPTPPPSPSISSGVTYAGSGNKKAYGIYVDPSSNLAYIAVDKTSNGPVNVVNATTGALVTAYPALVATGQSIYYSSGYVYVTIGNTLYAINTSTSKSYSIGLDGNGLKVVVAQPYAYVATDNTTKQVDIVNITDPTKMTKTSLNLGNGASGVDVSIDSSNINIAIATANVSPKKDLFVYKLSASGIGSLVGSYDSLAMNPSGVALTPDGILIAVGSGGQQYQVFDTTGTNPSCPAGLTNPNGAGAINSVSYLKEPDSDVFAYIITSGGTEGNKRYLQIIAGGPGGGGTYASPKTYYSPIIPVPYVSHDVAFNNYTAVTSTNPPTTNITFMFAIHEETGGSCPAGPYPDSDFVAPITGGQIPLSTTATYHNPGECLEYKATLTTTDSSQTPTLSSVTINYSQ